MFKLVRLSHDWGRQAHARPVERHSSSARCFTSPQFADSDAWSASHQTLCRHSLAAEPRFVCRRRGGWLERSPLTNTAAATWPARRPMMNGSPSATQPPSRLQTGRHQHLHLHHDDPKKQARGDKSSPSYRIMRAPSESGGPEAAEAGHAPSTLSGARHNPDEVYESSEAADGR
jgi:hypothetical protein